MGHFFNDENLTLSSSFPSKSQYFLSHDVKWHPLKSESTMSDGFKVSLRARAYCFPDLAWIILIPSLLYEKAR